MAINKSKAFTFALMLVFLIGGIFGMMMAMLYGTAVFLGIVAATTTAAVAAALHFIVSFIVAGYSYVWFVRGITE